MPYRADPPLLEKGSQIFPSMGQAMLFKKPHTNQSTLKKLTWHIATHRHKRGLLPLSAISYSFSFFFHPPAHQGGEERNNHNAAEGRRSLITSLYPAHRHHCCQQRACSLIRARLPSSPACMVIDSGRLTAVNPIRGGTKVDFNCRFARQLFIFWSKPPHQLKLSKFQQAV